MTFLEISLIHYGPEALEAVKDGEKLEVVQEEIILRRARRVTTCGRSRGGEEVG